MKKVWGILAGLAVFTVTLTALFYLFELNANSRRKTSLLPQKKHSLIVPGSSPGIFHRVFLRTPGSVVNIKSVIGEKVVYDQNYHTDMNLFRVPIPENNRAKLHAIFGGCSYTWGEGLKENETLPWLFQASLENVQAYNLGFPGGGINTLLRYSEIFDFGEVVKKKRGFFIYTFMSNHFDRFFARYNFLSWVHDGSPHYQIENRKLVYKGEIKDQDIYKKFHAIKKAGLEHTLLNTQKPEDWSEQEIHDYSLAVKELERRYLQKIPKGHFVFLFHPDGGFGGEIRNVLKRELRRLEITYYDVDEEFQQYLSENGLTHLDMKIPVDGHPNHKMNSFLAKTLATKLKTDYRNLK